MAQTGFTPLLIYGSTTPSNVPSAGDLTTSASGVELAVNAADGKLFYKDNGGVVQVLATKAGASGDVVGPASATANAIVLFDGTTGKLIKNSAVTLPAGSLVGTSDSQTLTNKTISGSNNTLSNIPNGSLVNSAISVNGTSISLGASGTITAVNPNALTISTGLSGVSYNGSSAVTIAIDSTVATLTGSQTLTNKRINPRVSSSATAATLTPDIASFDQYNLTAQNQALAVAAPIGTPVDGSKLIIRILDNGTSRAITWNGTYTVIGVILPPATVANKMLYVGCIYNSANTRWDVLAVNLQA